MDSKINISQTMGGDIVCKMEFKIYAEDVAYHPELAEKIVQEFTNRIKKRFDGKRQRLQEDDPHKQMAQVESKEVDGESNLREMLGGVAASDRSYGGASHPSCRGCSDEE